MWPQLFCVITCVSTLNVCVGQGRSFGQKVPSWWVYPSRAASHSFRIGSTGEWFRLPFSWSQISTLFSHFNFALHDGKGGIRPGLTWNVHEHPDNGSGTATLNQQFRITSMIFWPLKPIGFIVDVQRSSVESVPYVTQMDAGNAGSLYHGTDL